MGWKVFAITLKPDDRYVFKDQVEFSFVKLKNVLLRKEAAGRSPKAFLHMTSVQGLFLLSGY